MPKGKRKVEDKVRRPLIRIERVFYEKASFRLRTDVLANIEQYVLYIKEMTGDEPRRMNLWTGGCNACLIRIGDSASGCNRRILRTGKWRRPRKWVTQPNE